MSRRLALLLAAVLAAGCGTGRASQPLAERVELVLHDERPAALDDPGAFLFMPYWPWPLIPFVWEGEIFYPDRSFTPELTAAVIELNLFAQVVGAGDLPAAREGAPYVLDVTWVETRTSQTVTSYGLGLFSVLLYALGAPMTYERTVVELRASCRPRGQAVVAEGEGCASDVELLWLYGEGERTSIGELVREALGEALEDLLDE